MNMHINGPGAPQDALYIRTPVTPEEAFQAIGRLRKEARDEIDRLIRFLDKTDDYVARELEEGADDVPCDDDEREASFSGVGADGAASLSGFDSDELEAEDVRGGNAEAEPSLGSTNDYNGNGTNYGINGCAVTDGEGPDDDLEPSLCGVSACDLFGDDRDREDDREDEPSLGSLETFDQSRWSQSSRSEREIDEQVQA